jgi:hypothetical protein
VKLLSVPTTGGLSSSAQLHRVTLVSSGYGEQRNIKKIRQTTGNGDERNINEIRQLDTTSQRDFFFK